MISIGVMFLIGSYAEFVAGAPMWQWILLGVVGIALIEGGNRR